MDLCSTMKSSARITATLFAVVSLAAATGCRKPEMQRCVDQHHIVVDDDFCHSNGEQRVLGRKPEQSASYRYYYGGTGSTHAGTLATGGSYLRMRDQTYAVAGQRHQHLKNVWPYVGVAALVVLLLFAWEGRRTRT
jgi:hypothetical protein